MPTPLGCPRCHTEVITSKTQTVQLPTGQLDLEQNICKNCGTKWYFEENIYPVFLAAAKK